MAGLRVTPFVLGDGGASLGCETPNFGNCQDKSKARRPVRLLYDSLL